MLRRIFSRVGLVWAAFLAATVLGLAANDLNLSTGTSFINGPRLTDGADLNVVLRAVNVLRDQADGSTAGAYTGTFNGTVGATTPSTGAFTTVVASAAITPTGGVAAAAGFTASPRTIHTCAKAAVLSTDGTDVTPAVTEQFAAEVFIPANMTVTGVAIFNGSAVAGNVQISMYTSAGAPITAAQSASTALSGTDAYQLVPFATPWAAKGPATYYVNTQYNNTGARLNTILFGTSCGTVKYTSQTYGTFVAQTAPTTFTASVGPYASLY